jgi:hypothetical protein
MTWLGPRRVVLGRGRIIGSRQSVFVRRLDMNPALFAALTNAAIPFFVGVFAILHGYRLIGTRPGENAKWDEWHKQHGKVLRILGPVLIVVSLGLIIGRLVGGD